MFGSDKLIKNTDLDKYKYAGYDIGFDSRGEYYLPDGSIGTYLIVFRVDMSWSVHIDNKGKDTLIIGKGPIQGLDGTTFTRGALYPFDFTKSGKRLYQVYTITEVTVFCLSMLQKYINSKQNTKI